MMEKQTQQNFLTATLREHPALLLSFTYVVASAIGMFYSWNYLRRFGIDVFEYAQLSDFLLASLKEPYTWLLSIVVVVGVALDNVLSRRVGSRTKSRWISWYGHPRYRYLNFIIAVMIMALLLDHYATIIAKKTVEGEGQIVEVRPTEDEAKTLLLLGTTGQFIFFYDAATRQVTIHPNDSIHSISFLAP